MESGASDGGSPAARGRLRVYLGATPGSGKTYAMLREGSDRLAAGQDVVVGFVETHGRPRTQAALEGLEVIPRRCVVYRGRPCDDMDVEAVLRRRPEVVLVDELAHTNLPGARHERRWQDVDEIRAHGIDVVTTVNIQAIESMRDLIEDITGVPVRETVPDRVIEDADEVQFIDISPEALRKRMRHGNVYAADKVDIALANFFRPGNLAALRELALRMLADTVGTTRGSVGGTPQDVLVSVSGRPSSEALIRRGARMARRFGGFCTVLRVAIDDEDVSPEIVERCRILAQELGARWREVEARSVDDAVVATARELGVEHVLVGEAGQPGLFARFRKGLVDRLIEDLPDVSVHVIARHVGLPVEGRPTLEAEPSAPVAAEAAPRGRGSLRVYLGYARGCGTTTAMLEEAQRRRSRGTDVVVAAVRTHGHATAVAALEGLETLGGPDGPATRVTLDVEELLRRAPAVACIDEIGLADVGGRTAAEALGPLLEVGITLIATVHLSSLASVRAELAERIGVVADGPGPVDDALLGLAAEVELVDVTPGVLLERLAHGEIVPPEEIERARAGEFREDVLNWLRQRAFRVIADHTDRRLVAYMRERSIATPWEARPRIIACVPGRPGNEWLIRRAAALTHLIDGDLHVVTVREHAERVGEAGRLLDAYEALTSELGGRFVVLEARDVVKALSKYARESLATELIVTRGGDGMGRGTLRQLVASVHDVDVHILAAAESNVPGPRGDAGVALPASPATATR